MYANSSPEAQSYFPAAASGPYGVRPERYLDLIRRGKEAVSIPIIASLNGSSPAGWMEYARFIEQAGAAAAQPCPRRRLWFTRPSCNGGRVVLRLSQTTNRVLAGIVMDETTRSLHRTSEGNPLERPDVGQFPAAKRPPRLRVSDGDTQLEQFGHMRPP